MKILIYKGQSGYEALRVFADELAEGLRNLSHEVEVFDFTKPGEDEKLYELLERREGAFYPDVILAMNGIKAAVHLPDGKLLHNQIDAPMVSYIVDHPLYHHQRLRVKLKKHHVLCVNGDFASYIRKYYQNVKNVEIMMQAGIGEAGDIPVKEREYDVAFLGTYRNEKEIERQIEASDEVVKNVTYSMLEILLQEPGLTLEEAFDRVLVTNGIRLPENAYADTMNAMHLADKYVRALYRRLAVKSLVEQGIRVDVWGERWEEIKPTLSKPELLKVHKPVSYRETVGIYRNAKVVLNVMPWAKDGLHDRILSTMLSGAVSVTDATKLLEAEWNQEDALSIYSLNNLPALAKNVKLLLADNEKMEMIAANGRKRAMEAHTWQHRAQQLEVFLEKVLKEEN